MRVDGCDKDVRVVRSGRVNFVIDDDLVLRLLQLHHLAELVRFDGFALAVAVKTRREELKLTLRGAVSWVSARRQGQTSTTRAPRQAARSINAIGKSAGNPGGFRVAAI